MYTSLYSLNPGETGIIAEICCNSPALSQTSIILRLTNLGFLPGIPVTCTGTSALGSPKAFLICGTLIALRPSDAAGIMIQKI
ncbi:MAG: ferrous iron transport protein A [Blautia sp.]